MPTVAFATLGCKVNQDETAGIEALFSQGGYEVVSFSEPADVYIVNTCTVTHLGSRKSRQLLRQARRTNSKGLVVAAGCYPQTSPEELLAVEEVDLIVGNSHKHKLVELVEQAQKDRERRVVVAEPGGFYTLPLGAIGRQRATLKIQEGCRRFCTYCIVPFARGDLRSMPPKTVVEKALALEEMGYREIVLTGINLTSYGREGDELELAQVLDGLGELKHARIRISSVEPNDVNSRLLDAFSANPRICRHFHIPLQSGSSTVLKQMGRKYTQQDYLDLVKTIKGRFNNPSFSTDIIVGFPGETEDDFLETVAVVREVGFCRLHVFRYSPRQGTPAAGYPDQVLDSLKSERSRILSELGELTASQYAQSLVGLQEGMLAEEHSALIVGGIAGYGERYLRIHCPGQIILGSLRNVEIIGHRGADLLGKLV